MPRKVQRQRYKIKTIYKKIFSPSYSLPHPTVVPPPSFPNPPQKQSKPHPNPFRHPANQHSHPTFFHRHTFGRSTILRPSFDHRLTIIYGRRMVERWSNDNRSAAGNTYRQRGKRGQYFFNRCRYTIYPRFLRYSVKFKPIVIP